MIWFIALFSIIFIILIVSLLTMSPDKREAKSKTAKKFYDFILGYEDDISNATVSKPNIVTPHIEVDTILAEIDQMDGHLFEEWCSKLLTRTGFDKATVTKASGDQGVDIVAEKNGIRYAIQCKRYLGRLSNSPIQEVYSGKAIYACTYAVVMTNSYFTKSAINMAQSLGVELWDRNTITTMLQELPVDAINSLNSQEKALNSSLPFQHEYESYALSEEKKVIVSTEDGDFSVLIKGAHWVSWQDEAEELNGFRVFSLDSIVENYNYESKYGIFLFEHLRVTDEEGFSLQYYDLSGPNNGKYLLNHITKKNERVRVGLSYYAPINCETVVVYIDEKVAISVPITASEP